MTENILMTCLSGSYAYGTEVEGESDVDIRGVFVGSKEQLRTPWGYKGEMTQNPQWLKDLYPNELLDDSKWFELNKCFVQMLQCNPNFVELLWTPEENILQTSPEWKLIQDHKHKFLTKRIVSTHLGYALNQIEKMKSRKKKINTPQHIIDDTPVESSYLKLIQNFTPSKIMPDKFSILDYTKDHALYQYKDLNLGLYVEEGSWCTTKDHRLKIKRFNEEEELKVDRKSPKMLLTFNKEQFHKDLDAHKKYWEWKNNRNPERAALEIKHNIDLKNSQHLIRLCLMVRDVLKTGKVIVKRPDNQLLRDIRNGIYTYDEIMEMSLDIRSEISILESKSDLPPESEQNFELAQKLILQVQDQIWNK